MKWMLGRQAACRVPFPDQSFLLSESSPEVASLLSLERKREREPEGAEPRTEPPAARSLLRGAAAKGGGERGCAGVPAACKWLGLCCCLLGGQKLSRRRERAEGDGL